MDVLAGRVIVEGLIDCCMAVWLGAVKVAGWVDLLAGRVAVEVWIVCWVAWYLSG